jgi:hypothetical protein
MARSGAFAPDATVWHEGAADWYPLAEFLLRPEATASAAAPEIPAGPPLSPSELQQEILRNKRAALAADAAQEGATLFKALGAGLGVAVLGGALYLSTFWFTKPMLIPGPIVLIGMAVGGTITKVGRGEGSSLLPLGAVIFTLLAYGMVGFPLVHFHLLLLGMGLFMAFKLAYL